MKGSTPSYGTRYYYIYFKTGTTSTPKYVAPQVALTDNVWDEGQYSYKITNYLGSLYFQKKAGGFSSWTDIGGKDWISWNTAPGGAGKYRGIPNAVNPEAVFHPGFYCCTSTIVSKGPLKIRVKSVNGTKWESIWDFYPRYATMTMTKAAHNYWFLYEGTPGGLLEPNKDYMVRSNGAKTFLSTSWTGDIPSNEWVYFSDPTLGRSLYETHHEDDILRDSYWNMNNQMTVFGFGRGSSFDTTKYLSYVPQRFTIGLLNSVDFTQNSKQIYSAYKSLKITKFALKKITTETTKETQEPTETVTITEKPIITNIPEPVDITNTEEVPGQITGVTQYSIGQSANNGQTKITLNDMRFSKTIKNNKASPGNQFLIINLTIENIGNGDLSYSAHQFIILETYADIETIYQVDEPASSILSNLFNGENIKRGDKRQGEFVYRVPNDARGLVLKFEYSDLTSEFFLLN